MVRNEEENETIFISSTSKRVCFIKLGAMVVDDTVYYIFLKFVNLLRYGLAREAKCF